MDIELGGKRGLSARHSRYMRTLQLQLQNAPVFELVLSVPVYTNGASYRGGYAALHGGWRKLIVDIELWILYVLSSHYMRLLSILSKTSYLRITRQNEGVDNYVYTSAMNA